MRCQEPREGKKIKNDNQIANKSRAQKIINELEAEKIGRFNKEQERISQKVAREKA